MSVPDFASAAQVGLPQLATPASPGTLVTSLVSAGRSRASGVSRFRQLGLAMRFNVEVTDLGLGRLDLGQWTSCEGLRVDFKFDAIRSGGDYGTTHVLPQMITFSPVTLKRAVENPHSETVQQWLRKIAVQWREATDVPKVGTTVTIKMLDVYQDKEEPAAKWQLRNAFPIAWVGPSMSAKSGEVASETLVLEHDGFLDPPV